MSEEKLAKYFSDDVVEDKDILGMMLLNLQNSLKLSDRCMSDSSIKILYVFLMKNNQLLARKEVREQLAVALSPVNDLINNHFLNAIMNWTELKLSKRPNRKDLPPVSAETRKAMEAKAIKIDEVLQKRHQWAKDNPESVVKTKPRTFKVNDIVGVKDKEHKWCMARVLLVMDDPDFYTPWYYVHFHNWDVNFREWIGDANRIKPYLPKRDRFKR